MTAALSPRSALPPAVIDRAWVRRTLFPPGATVALPPARLRDVRLIAPPLNSSDPPAATLTAAPSTVPAVLVSAPPAFTFQVVTPGSTLVAGVAPRSSTVPAAMLNVLPLRGTTDEFPVPAPPAPETTSVPAPLLAMFRTPLAPRA